jgi:hypothetical protein
MLPKILTSHFSGVQCWFRFHFFPLVCYARPGSSRSGLNTLGSFLALASFGEWQSRSRWSWQRFPQCWHSSPPRIHIHGSSSSHSVRKKRCFRKKEKIEAVAFLRRVGTQDSRVQPDVHHRVCRPPTGQVIAGTVVSIIVLVFLEPL